VIDNVVVKSWMVVVVGTERVTVLKLLMVIGDAEVVIVLREETQTG
jgi:hypothetical protein